MIQKVPARKALNVIPYYLSNKNRPWRVTKELISRTLINFKDAVEDDARRYSQILERTIAALDAGELTEFTAGVALLRLQLPRETYGEITAGTEFVLFGLTLIKRKGGIEVLGLGPKLWPHLAVGTPVVIRGGLDR